MPTLTFTEGNDSYVVDTDDTYTLSFLGGDDTLTLNAPGATTGASMGDGNDLVRFYGGAASILGDAGADRFDIYASGLVADGGMGNDRFNIRGGNGHQLAGGQGNDAFVFYANSSDVSLDGGDGNDVFYGLSHAITGTIFGDAGSDLFSLFGSGVTLAGGDGNDHYRISASGGAPDILENANEGLDRVDVARGYSYALPENVENLVVVGYAGGSDGEAALVGNALANKIVGGSNAETLDGLDGNDKLYGNGGDDSLNGGLGRDYLDGGAGNDALHGGDGNDSLHGSGGNDLLDGGDGTDMLDGGGGDDILISGSGGGTLIGGGGADALEGGSGKDTFKFFTLSDSTVDAPDTITGFSSPDRVNLVAIDADSTLPGNQAFMVVNASTGAAGQAWTTWDGTYTHIFTDIDGGGADMQILVAGPLNTHSDVIW